MPLKISPAFGSSILSGGANKITPIAVPVMHLETVNCFAHASFEVAVELELCKSFDVHRCAEEVVHEESSNKCQQISCEASAAYLCRVSGSSNTSERTNSAALNCKFTCAQAERYIAKS